MASQEYPTVNGVASSWADIEIKFDIPDAETVKITDISGIKYESSVERGEQKGTSGGRVMKRTAGSVTHTGSATFYRSGLMALQRALMAVAPTRGNQVLVGQVAFQILIQHSPLGSDEIFEAVMKGCHIDSKAFDTSEGTDADKFEVNLNPIENADIIDGKEVVLI